MGKSKEDEDVSQSPYKKSLEKTKKVAKKFGKVNYFSYLCSVKRMKDRWLGVLNKNETNYIIHKIMTQINFYRDVDSKTEFINAVASFCRTIHSTGVVKTNTKEGNNYTTLWYEWEASDFLNIGSTKSVALIGKVDTGSLKDMGIKLNGDIIKVLGYVEEVNNFVNEEL